MLNASFHVMFYTVLFFAVGMIKPKWALFFLKNPTRFPITVIGLIGFMVAMTLFGEGHKEKTLQEKKMLENTSSVTPASELPQIKN